MVAGDWIGEVDAMMFAVLLELLAIVVPPRAEDGTLELHLYVCIYRS